jgi:hypothetical protein
VGNILYGMQEMSSDCAEVRSMLYILYIYYIYVYIYIYIFIYIGAFYASRYGSSNREL